MSGVVIGLDVGTTSAKAVAFAVGSTWRYTAARDCPPGPAQDTELLRTAVLGALAECAAACAGREVLAVSVSTAMHGLLALDSGRLPLTPLLTWADGRAAAQAQRLLESGEAEAVRRVSGAPMHPMTPLAKLLWFRENEPGLWARARWWAGLKELVLLHLTGTLATELSSASGTGLLDVNRRDWNPAALRLAGVRSEQLPAVLPTTATLQLSADAARATGLPQGTPVVAGAADGPLGNLGTGATAPGVASLSLGTSGAVRLLRPGPFADPEGRLFSYALTDAAWVVGGALSNGGGLARWAGEVFAADRAPDPRREADLLELAARVPPGCDGLVMLPYLLPERAPLWRPDLTGAFLGITARHTRAHFVRAALEAAATRLAEIVTDLDRVHPVQTVLLTGGAFRSPLWQEVVTTAIDRPAVLASATDGTALGAAALALHALGLAPDLAAAPTAFPPDAFTL